MRHFAKVVNGEVVQYPYIRNRGADPDNGILDVVVEKPNSIDHETEVWEADQFEVYDDFVKVIKTKRAKNQQELAARAAEKQAERAKFLQDKNEIVETMKGYIQSNQLTREELSELITLLKSKV